MTTPTITLKSITINEPQNFSGVEGNRTATLLFAVSLWRRRSIC